MPYTITREDAERDLRALRGVLSGFPVGVSSSAVPAIRELIDSIEEQLKPAFEEPEAFGSLIRARTPQENDQVAADLWQMSPAHGKHYWMSQSGVLEVWSELTDVEVLRVGLGEEKPLTASDLSRMSVEAHQAKLNGEATAYREGEAFGQKVMNGKIHVRLRELLAEAITGERKNAFEKAIQAVEELAP